MKFVRQLVTVGAVLIPAAAFGFAGYSGKPTQEAAPSVQKEAVAPESAAMPAPVKKEKAPTHRGKVLESMNGGGYTYIYLEKKSGEKHWYAVPEAKVVVGQDVEVMPGMEMGKFTSRALNRTFESINFSGGMVVAEDDETVKKKAHAGIVSGTTGKDEAGEAPIKVEKAAGANAFTIEEIYGKKGGLAGKSVAVRGKIVKVSEGIMNKNWIHLRDGSGSAAAGNHNLIVTSSEVPAMGDVVTVTGDLAVEKDFGSGYKYDIIIENGAFKK